MNIAPKLTEPGIKYFLNQSLKQCHHTKMVYYNKIVNISLFLFFITLLGIMLLYKYKGKLTEEEKREKDREKYKYILEKIRIVKEDKMKMNQELITGLPNWNNDYENI